MRLSDLTSKHICILGFGREGQAMLRALIENGLATDVTIADQNEQIQPGEYPMQTGKEYLQNLDKFDVIIKSPGIPWGKELTAIKDKVISSSQIFFDSVAGSGVILIGVTGSKGKSTTATLIYELLKAGGKDAFLMGNIGKPMISFLSQAKAGSYFVLELSSYQLAELEASPHIAVITSFFPEHLDYHGSLGMYKDAKKHIARFQGEGDMIFYNADSPETADIAAEGHGKKISFSAADAPLPLEETHLLGRHNLGNIAAAYAVAQHLGIPQETCITVLKEFEGLPHRLQSLGVHQGIEWVDDAISTTPESAMAALDALGQRVHTIILGGQDRGNDFTKLAKRIVRSGVRTVILFPGSGPRIRQAIERALEKDAPSPHIDFFDVPDMQTAVREAKAHTPKDMICLLSTASPSYGMFTNFEEKGEMFAECIRPE